MSATTAGERLEAAIERHTRIVEADGREVWITDHDAAAAALGIAGEAGGEDARIADLEDRVRNDPSSVERMDSRAELRKLHGEAGGGDGRKGASESSEHMALRDAARLAVLAAPHWVGRAAVHVALSATVGRYVAHVSARDGQGREIDAQAWGDDPAAALASLHEKLRSEGGPNFADTTESAERLAGAAHALWVEWSGDPLRPRFDPDGKDVE